MFCLKKVCRPKETFFEERRIEKESTINPEHFTVGIIRYAYPKSPLVHVLTKLTLGISEC